MNTALIAALALASAPGPGGSTSLQHLVERIPHVADVNEGVGEAEQELATGILAHGAAAIPHLLPLLRSESEPIRGFAGYVLRDLDGLTEAHLDALIEARLHGDGWIPPAIARVGTPRAVAFLVEDLKDTRESQSQLTYALTLVGRKAAAPLAEPFGASEPMDVAYVSAVCEVLNEMGANARPAVAPLMRALTVETSHPENREHAVLVLGCIGPVAASAVPTLQALRKNPSLREAAEDALMRMGPAAAIPVIVEHLRTKPTVILLRDLSELRAKGAGSAVLALLSNEDPRLRFAAARTLGYIQSTAATDALITLLGDVRDWRMAFSAAEALGRLRATRALAPLKAVATKHWAPPVREAARKAMKVIGGKETYAPGSPNFAIEFFAYDRMRFDQPALPEPALAEAPEELQKGSFEPLTYDTAILSVGAAGERSTPIKQTPQFGLSIANGHLVGASRGEWGGELMHLPADGAAKKILDANATGLHKVGEHLVAVTGLAHIVSNGGMLYRLVPRDGTFVAEPWRALPGAPRRSGLLPDGRLLVSCVGADVVVTADGDMRLATAQDVSGPTGTPPPALSQPE
ncbi:HEAT repeat domain-containing protein [Myxococcus sp. 1LA]